MITSCFTCILVAGHQMLQPGLQLKKIGIIDIMFQFMAVSCFRQYLPSFLLHRGCIKFSRGSFHTVPTCCRSYITTLQRDHNHNVNLFCEEKMSNK